MFQNIFQSILLKKIRLYGYIYDFSIDNNSIDPEGIFDIHKYLIVNNR